MAHVVATVVAATALLLAVPPAHGFGGMGGTTGHGAPVVVAPQQTFPLSSHQAVIVPRPFPSPQGFFIPTGVTVPSGFVPCLVFHRHFGHVVAFAHPVTFVISPVGFWWWSGTAWTWVAQSIVW